jgi:hypothetical protein
MFKCWPVGHTKKKTYVGALKVTNFILAAYIEVPLKNKKHT